MLIRPQPAIREPGRIAVMVSLLALTYFIVAAVSMANFGINTPIWFCNALAVAWLLQMPDRSWPWVVGTIYVIDTAAIAIFGSGPAPILAIADAFEVCVAAVLVRHFGGVEAALRSPGGLARLIIICLSVPLVSAAWGASVLSWFEGDPFLSGFIIWYGAAALGLLMVCPTLMIWSTPALRASDPSDRPTLALLLAGLAALTVFLTGLDAPAFLFVTFLVVLLIAWRGGLMGASLASAVLVAIGLWRMFTYSDAMAVLVFPDTDSLAQIQAMQIYLAALTLSSLPLAVVLADQRRLSSELARVAEARTEFHAAMSHEIRTPLTGVLGIVHLLETEHPTARQKSHLINIRSAGAHLLGVINDVLDFTRIETGHIELEQVDFSLPTLLEQVQSVLHALAAERGITLTVGLTDLSPPVVKGDPARIKQVLLNLAGNAIKFTPDGSVLVIAAHCPTKPGHHFRFEVRDTGIGIAEDELLHIFDAFTQADSSTSRRYGGSGLGLAISKRLVTAMGGEIGVESKLGEGSLFWFEVPFEPGDAINLSIASDNAALPIEPRRILLAEDVKVNRDIIHTVLEREGHQVTIAENGLEALDFAQRDTFDLILMDVHMPIMDGLDATCAIRALGGLAGATPIVALTANVMASEQEKCRRAGMNAVLMKPVDWEQVRDAIRRYARGGREGKEQLPGASQDLRPKMVGAQSDNPASPILQRLAELDAMEPGLGHRVGILFLDDSRARLGDLAVAFECGDADAIFSLAHAIRGAAANVGAEAIAQASETLEVLARTGDLRA